MMLSCLCRLKQKIFQISRKFPWECIKKEGFALQWILRPLQKGNEETTGFLADLDKMNRGIHGFYYRGQREFAIPSYGLCSGFVYKRKQKNLGFRDICIAREFAGLSLLFARERNNPGVSLLLDADSAQSVPSSVILDGYRIPGREKACYLYGYKLNPMASKGYPPEEYKKMEDFMKAAVDALFREERDRAVERLNNCLAILPGYAPAKSMLNRISQPGIPNGLRSYRISWV